MNNIGIKINSLNVLVEYMVYNVIMVPFNMPDVLLKSICMISLYCVGIIRSTVMLKYISCSSIADVQPISTIKHCKCWPARVSAVMVTSYNFIEKEYSFVTTHNMESILVIIATDRHRAKYI